MNAPGSNFTHDNHNCDISLGNTTTIVESIELQKLDAQKRDHDKIKADSCISALYAITP